MKEILEIGPGPNPMHHRLQKRLDLADDEKYTGIDQREMVEDLLNHEVWKLAKEQYGDRAFLIEGDRTNLENIENSSIDELVALGSHSQEGKVVAEFNRVLKEGGILRLGTMEGHLKGLMNGWGARLKRLGYQALPNQESRYGYFGNVSISRPYVVVSWQKGVKDNKESL